jgi:hypothetical protein
MKRRDPAVTNEYSLGELQKMRDLLVEALSSVDDAIDWEEKSGLVLSAFNKSMFDKAMKGLASFQPKLKVSVTNARRGIVFPPGQQLDENDEFIRNGGHAKKKPLPDIPGVQVAQIDEDSERRRQSTESGVESASRKKSTRSKAAGNRSTASRKRKQG